MTDPNKYLGCERFSPAMQDYLSHPDKYKNFEVPLKDINHYIENYLTAPPKNYDLGEPIIKPKTKTIEKKIQEPILA